MDQRIEFALKALKTDNFRALCAEYGISAKTGYKWRERLLQFGLAGLSEQSRRPRGHAEQLPEGTICEMVRLKVAHRHWGPRKIRELYLRLHGRAASESSFKPSPGTGRPDRATPTPATGQTGGALGQWTPGPDAQRSLDGGLQGLVV
jgi:hypothetical protein